MINRQQPYWNVVCCVDSIWIMYGRVILCFAWQCQSCEIATILLCVQLNRYRLMRRFQLLKLLQIDSFAMQIVSLQHKVPLFDFSHLVCGDDDWWFKLRWWNLIISRTRDNAQICFVSLILIRCSASINSMIVIGDLEAVEWQETKDHASPHQVTVRDLAL